MDNCPEENMKIGFCQIKVVYKDIQSNLQKIDSLLSSIKADLIVLPELCFTGYAFSDKKELIPLSDEKSQNTIIDGLSKIAKRMGGSIVAGISEYENAKLYNTAVVIGPNGLIGKHRKINLTKNETVFDPGDLISTFLINGIKIGVAICFDTWFPEIFRILTLKGARIICCPANFGGPWTLDVIKVRALENCVYTVMSNRTGNEMMNGEEIGFRGESEIVDFGGNVLIKAGNEECVECIDVDIEANTGNKNIICDDLAYERNKYNKYVTYRKEK